MTNPRQTAPPRRLTTALTIASLSFLLLAVALLATLWQSRLASAWARAPLPRSAEIAGAMAPNRKALWIMHPGDETGSSVTTLLGEAPLAQASAPWSVSGHRASLVLLLAGLTPDSPEALESGTALPGQPMQPYALLTAAADAGRRAVLALPLSLADTVAASPTLTVLASDAVQSPALLQQALADDSASLVIVYLAADGWATASQRSLTALTQDAVARGWLVAVSALPGEANPSGDAHHTLTRWTPEDDPISFGAQDLAPTIAWWLGLAPLPLSDGRPLAELLTADPIAWATTELAAAQHAQARAVERLAPINGIAPPQVGRDIAAAQAALAAGNWRGARQLATLARNAALTAERTQRAAAAQRQRVNRGVLAGVALLTLGYGLRLASGRRLWPNLHAGSVGAAVLAVCIIAAPDAVAWGSLAGRYLSLAALLASAAATAVALAGGLALERRTAAELWYDMALAGLWLAWLALLPLGGLFTSQGAWLTWQPQTPELAALMHRLLGALGGVALGGAILPALVTALLGLAQGLWAAARRAIYAQREALHAHRHHR